MEDKNSKDYKKWYEHLCKKRFADAAADLTGKPPNEVALYLERLFSVTYDNQLLEKGLKLLDQEEYDEAISLLSTGAGHVNDILLNQARDQRELSEYTNELAHGNLSVDFPIQNNSITQNVMELHSNLNHIAWQINEVAKGDYEQISEDIGKLSEGFNEMTSQLSSRKDQIEYELHHDALTGLLNRYAFMQTAYSMIQKAPDKHGFIVCCGLDNIKYVNDAYGHENGDMYILAAADKLRSFEEDGAITARIAGDEFAIYMHGFDEELSISCIEEMIMPMLSDTSIINEDDIRIRASFGVSFYPNDASTIDNLLKFASHTMFEVKKSNRGTMRRFSHEIFRNKSHVFDRQELLNRLIEEKQIRFAFQPIIKLSDKALFGYEALMRPSTPDFTGPLDILHLAEVQSKLNQLEKITYEIIFDWIYQNISCLGGLKVFFNTISSQFLNKKALMQIHAQYRIITDKIIFELLEHAVGNGSFIQDVNSFRNKLGALIAIDDYGTGYSNDSRLLAIAPDIVKIDRFLIENIDQSPDKQNLISRLIDFCSKKGIEVLAEGIETEAELKTAIDLGFTYGQGYYIGMPNFTLEQPKIP